MKQSRGKKNTYFSELTGTITEVLTVSEVLSTMWGISLLPHLWTATSGRKLNQDWWMRSILAQCKSMKDTDCNF